MQIIAPRKTTQKKMEKMLLMPLTPEELRQMFKEELHVLLDAFAGRHSEVREKDLLVTEEACALLNLTRGTLYGLVHRKAIPHMKRGKRLYFSQKELTAWVAAERRATQDEIAAQAAAYLEKNN